MGRAAVVEVARRRAPLVPIGGQRKGWAQGEEVSHPPCGGTQPRMPQPPRRPDLQGARGVVVSAVVGYHALRLVLDRQSGDWGDVSPMWWWAATGRLGVDAFFVLAGYLVVGSWNTCRAGTASRLSAVAEFARRRSWRILPPYLAMLAVVVPLARPTSSPATTLGATWRAWSPLQQYLDPDLTSHVNIPIWSLTTEGQLLPRGAPRGRAPRSPGEVGDSCCPPPRSRCGGRTPTSAATSPPGLLPGRIDQFVVGAAAGALIVSWHAGKRSRIVDALTTRAALPVLLVAWSPSGRTTARRGGAVTTGSCRCSCTPWRGGCSPACSFGSPAGRPPACSSTPPSPPWGASASASTSGTTRSSNGVCSRCTRTQPMGLMALIAVVLIAAGVGVAAFAHALIEEPAARHEQERRARRRSRPGSVMVPQRLG